MTNRNSNNINIPEAREAMDKFKMEAASDVDVPAPSSKTKPMYIGRTDPHATAYEKTGTHAFRSFGFLNTSSRLRGCAGLTSEDGAFQRLPRGGRRR